MKAAYGNAFRKENIQRGLIKTGLWPLGPDAVLGQERPLSAETDSCDATVEDMAKCWRK